MWSDWMRRRLDAPLMVKALSGHRHEGEAPPDHYPVVTSASQDGEEPMVRVPITPRVAGAYYCPHGDHG